MSNPVERLVMWSFFTWLFRRAVATARVVEWGKGWVWPVPTLMAPITGVYDAVVSSGFESSRRRRDGTKRQHRGLDIMYKRKDARDMPEMLVKTRDPRDDFASTKGYFAPVGTPILAARAGKVRSVKARGDGGGISVVIDHDAQWATYYTHLVDAYGLQSGVAVKAGERIGTMGGNLRDSERVRHLHFECWYQGDHPDHSEDAKAAGVMATWERRQWRPTTWP